VLMVQDRAWFAGIDLAGAPRWLSGFPGFTAAGSSASLALSRNVLSAVLGEMNATDLD
jgi:hypothetical protein